jgi:hypothetical protein
MAQNDVVEIASSPVPVADEDLIPTDEIQERLQLHLEAANIIESVAHHERLTDAPNPGLFIRGFGMFTFPLSEREVSVIKAASGKADLFLPTFGQLLFIQFIALVRLNFHSTY